MTREATILHGVLLSYATRQIGFHHHSVLTLASEHS